MSVNPAAESDLGLMGGMFDPVHNGHLNIAQNCVQALGLDALRFIPCGVPVHRENTLTDSRHRLEMLELAITGQEKFSIDDRECRSKEPSYMQTSLESIREENPEVRLFFLMGLDAFNSLPSWHRWVEIFELAHLVVATRPGVTPDFDGILQQEYEKRIASTVEEMKQYRHGRIYSAAFEELDISSSMIRERIARDDSLSGLVPRSVETYINNEHLYKEVKAS